MTPELDAQHRAQLAALLTETVSYLDWETATSAEGGAWLTDALAPLVAEWLADAWDAGRDQGQWDGIVGHHKSNPYRGGDS